MVRIARVVAPDIPYHSPGGGNSRCDRKMSMVSRELPVAGLCYPMPAG